MVSLPTAVYQGIRQYLPPEHDPVEVAIKIATVLATHRETVALPDTAGQATVVETEPSPSVVSEQTQVSQDAPAAVTGAEDGTVPVAADVRVANMPASARERAHLRMGRTKDGKSRP